MSVFDPCSTAESQLIFYKSGDIGRTQPLLSDGARNREGTMNDTIWSFSIDSKFSSIGSQFSRRKGSRTKPTLEGRRRQLTSLIVTGLFFSYTIQTNVVSALPLTINQQTFVDNLQNRQFIVPTLVNGQLAQVDRNDGVIVASSPGFWRSFVKKVLAGAGGAIIGATGAILSAGIGIGASIVVGAALDAALDESNKDIKSPPPTQNSFCRGCDIIWRGSG
jgi:hypothetical protein